MAEQPAETAGDDFGKMGKGKDGKDFGKDKGGKDGGCAQFTLQRCPLARLFLTGYLHTSIPVLLPVNILYLNLRKLFSKI